MGFFFRDRRTIMNIHAKVVFIGLGIMCLFILLYYHFQSSETEIRAKLTYDFKQELDKIEQLPGVVYVDSDDLGKDRMVEIVHLYKTDLEPAEVLAHYDKEFKRLG